MEASGGSFHTCLPENLVLENFKMTTSVTKRRMT
jgi:hypothetical protein